MASPRDDADAQKAGFDSLESFMISQSGRRRKQFILDNKQLNQESLDLENLNYDQHLLKEDLNSKNGTSKGNHVTGENAKTSTMEQSRNIQNQIEKKGSKSY